MGRVGSIGSAGGLMPNLSADAKDARMKRHSLIKGLGLEGDQPRELLSPEEQKKRSGEAVKMMQDAQENQDAAALLQGITLARDCHVERSIVENAA